MTSSYEYKKPKSVLHAEYALFVWTAWTSLFGVYQSWASIPDLEKMMTGQLQGTISIAPTTMLETSVGYYALQAVISIWIVFKIGAGKNWARTSLLVGLVFEIVCSMILAVLMPSFGVPQGLTEYLSYIPDLGLLGYATYLLYTWPGERWFNREARDIM